MNCILYVYLLLFGNHKVKFNDQTLFLLLSVV